MKYSNQAMEKYFQSLPPDVKDFIESSGVKISTLGELKIIGEHFKHSLEDSQHL